MRRPMLSALFLALLVPLPPSALAASPPPDGAPVVTITFFYGDGCPYCATEEQWLELLVEAYPGLSVTGYEVWLRPGQRATVR